MGLRFSKPKVKDRFDLQPFLMRRLPIFWVMGPKGCGKNTQACLLQKCSKYLCITVGDLISEELNKGKFRAKIIEECLKKNKVIPDEIIIMLIKEYIFLNYSNAKGFIFSGFPRTLSQARLFEIEIWRMITKNGDINTEETRREYVNGSKHCKVLNKNYESKIIKVINNYPPEDTCMKLVSDLEDYWGYKFDRVFTKN